MRSVSKRIWRKSRVRLPLRYLRAYKGRYQLEERKVQTHTVGQLIAYLQRFPIDSFVAVEDGYSDRIVGLSPGIYDGLNRVVFNCSEIRKNEIFYLYRDGKFKNFGYGRIRWKRPPLMDDGVRQNCYAYSDED